MYLVFKYKKVFSAQLCSLVGISYGQLTRATAVSRIGDYLAVGLSLSSRRFGRLNSDYILLTYCIIELILCLIFRSFSNL